MLDISKYNDRTIHSDRPKSKFHLKNIVRSTSTTPILVDIGYFSSKHEKILHLASFNQMYENHPSIIGAHKVSPQIEGSGMMSSTPSCR